MSGSVCKSPDYRRGLRQRQCFKVHYLPLQHTSMANNKLYTHAPQLDLPNHIAETVDLNHQAKALKESTAGRDQGFPGCCPRHQPLGSS